MYRRNWFACHAPMFVTNFWHSIGYCSEPTLVCCWCVWLKVPAISTCCHKKGIDVLFPTSSRTQLTLSLGCSHVAIKSQSTLWTFEEQASCTMNRDRSSCVPARAVTTSLRFGRIAAVIKSSCRPCVSTWTLRFSYKGGWLMTLTAAGIWIEIAFSIFHTQPAHLQSRGHNPNIR